MSATTPEETKKALKLIGAIVLVFGFGAWRVAGAVAPARSAPATVAEEAAPLTAAPAEAPQQDAPIKLPKAAVASNVDPFRTVAPLAGAQVSAPSLPPPPLSGALSAAPPVGPLTPLAAPRPTLVAPVEAKPTLRVTGILAGPNATAVLEIGDETRVVRLGDRLADGTVVLRIDSATVTVRRGTETLALDVGS